jgi:hypothetical protein
LVAPDKTTTAWPNEIKLGAGAKTFTLLKEVPIWYELWRQINGFPADYYKTGNTNNQPKSEDGKTK